MSPQRGTPRQVGALMGLAAFAVAFTALLTCHGGGGGPWPVEAARLRRVNNASGRSYAGVFVTRPIPWLVWHTRNPALAESQGDGFLTGLSSHVYRHVLIAHRKTIERASVNHSTDNSAVLMSREETATATSITGAKSHWPSRDIWLWHRVAEFGDHVAAYALLWRPLPKRRAAAAAARRRLATTESQTRAGSTDKRAPLPRYIWDVGVSQNCYVYALAVPDGTPRRDQVYGERKLARWPVELRGCFGSGDARYCKFWFDLNRGPASSNVGLICKTWQDVGAPVMCGRKPVGRPDLDQLSTDSWEFERDWLGITFVVIGPDPAGLQNNRPLDCSGGFLAVRLGHFPKSLRKMKRIGESDVWDTLYPDEASSPNRERRLANSLNSHSSRPHAT